MRAGPGWNIGRKLGLKMKIAESIDKFSSFIVEVGVELKKSAWPARRELLDSTVMVIVSVVMMAFFVGLCDLVLMRLLKFIV